MLTALAGLLAIVKRSESVFTRPGPFAAEDSGSGGVRSLSTRSGAVNLRENRQLSRQKPLLPERVINDLDDSTRVSPTLELLKLTVPR